MRNLSQSASHKLSKESADFFFNAGSPEWLFSASWAYGNSKSYHCDVWNTIKKSYRHRQTYPDFCSLRKTGWLSKGNWSPILQVLWIEFSHMFKSQHQRTKILDRIEFLAMLAVNSQLNMWIIFTVAHHDSQMGFIQNVVKAV